MHEGLSLNSPQQLSMALAALKRLDSILGKPKAPAAVVVTSRTYPCAICKGFHPIEAMHIIPTTRMVRNVVDCFCQTCYEEHREQLDPLARIVCATCRETVMVLEPHKERIGGFVWGRGSCSHVAICPSCSEDELPCSPVAEKIAFYKRQGIPYE